MRGIFAGEYACKLDDKGRFFRPDVAPGAVQAFRIAARRNGRCWSNRNESYVYGSFPYHTGARCLSSSRNG